MRKSWLDRIHDPELIRLWNETRLTINEIAREMGFSSPSIEKHARLLKLTARTPGRLRDKPLRASRNEQIKALADDGANVETLAIQFGVSAKTIQNILSKLRSGKKE